MHPVSFLLWAVVLFLQNISFTYVSRARSSGSIVRHLKASIFSNGIWIFSNMLMLGPMFDYLTGKHGVPAQIGSGIEYTIACVGGSIFAHYLAMKTEKGKNAVGFNKKYAQIPVEEWENVKALVAALDKNFEAGAVLPMLGPETLAAVKNLPTTLQQFEHVRHCAETAYDTCIGMIPDSGISAQKVGGVIVKSGV